MMLSTLAVVGELTGLVLGSYGLLRECFATLAEPRHLSEGRFGEGKYGGGPASWLVNVGVKIHLLPHDRQLTLTKRRRNASLAVAGVLIVAASLLLELVLALR